MRHGKKINHLGRTSSHRKAMLANMASSLIKSEKKRIITTLAKAKALRVFIEPLITKSKTNTTHSRRVVFSKLRDKEAAKILFGEVAAKVAERQGGYIRILKIGPRLGDNAEMALVEIVDFNEFITDKPKKKTRRRRKTKKKEAPKATEAAVEEVEAIEAEEAADEAGEAATDDAGDDAADAPSAEDESDAPAGEAASDDADEEKKEGE